MDESIVTDLAPPRIVAGGELLLAGLSRTYCFTESAAIPGQWQEFAPWVSAMPGQRGDAAYGVIHNGGDERYDYLCGVEVAEHAELPSGMTRLRIPPQTYAVFEHPGHVSGIRRTCNTIWSQWLPASGHEAADGPWFERYPPTFRPDTGLGGLEVWLAIRA